MKLFIVSVVAMMAILFAVTLICIAFYRNPLDKKLQGIGIVEKTAQVGELQFHYAEGPASGPVLLLLHAQLLDWYSYSKAMPLLTNYFHIYALDYPGHGQTRYPDDYEMSIQNIGESIADFITTVVQEPVYISGNSSGGLLAAWLAAYKPALVQAIVLEDPPLFSSEYPDVKNTIAYKSFTTSQRAVEAGEKDFLLYWVRESTQFFKTHIGSGSQKIVEWLCRYVRFTNPGKPLTFAFLPVAIQEMLRGLDMYDPRFGAAFYKGTWNSGVSHQDMLQKIVCPTLLLHADYTITEDRILNGAMTKEQAKEAEMYISNCNYVKVDSAHVIHLEHPEKYAQLIRTFLNK